MLEADTRTDEIAARRTRKHRALWVLGIVLAATALVLTPPLVNINRLRLRIAEKMSASLGRPVHMDRVSLNVLPAPGFTFDNLVVSEDPAFGAEPVIRANKVRATVRVSSLWRRQVEFSKIVFDVDEHGSGASVNLVRRADGRWNLESILLHASQQEAAPTAQAKAGPAPRFPYIEATGARVNVKLGDEKLPMALTEADFALWLPSPQQWRVRLEAKPARTDTNVSDTGTLAVEATLERAARIADVPLDLEVVWKRAPLGEASRLLRGVDAGWRGRVDASLVAHGTLGDAAATGKVKFEDVRRAEFVPAKMLSVTVECSARMAVTTAVLREPACTSKAEGGGLLAATADVLNLTGLHASGVRVGVTDMPDAWLLDWARLFSQRVPSNLAPKGMVSGSFVRKTGGAWDGELRDVVPVTLPAPAKGPLPRDTASVETRTLVVTAAGEELKVGAVNVAPAGAPTLMLSGEVTRDNYALRLTGTTSGEEWKQLVAMLPPLGDGVEAAALEIAASPAAAKLDVVCTRPWGAAQDCVAVKVETKVKGKRR